MLQEDTLNEIHNAHLEMTKMRLLARGYVQWPQTDNHIKQWVSPSEICHELHAEPRKAQIHPWIYPLGPVFMLIMLDQLKVPCIL